MLVNIEYGMKKGVSMLLCGSLWIQFELRKELILPE